MVKRALILGSLLTLFVVGCFVGHSVTVGYFSNVVSTSAGIEQRLRNDALGVAEYFGDLEFRSSLTDRVFIDAEQHSNNSDHITNDSTNRLVAELEHQLASVDRLRKRVATLEWETLLLESDLLARETDLAKARQLLAASEASKTRVYNITNVPVGGYVVSEPTPQVQPDQVVDVPVPQITESTGIRGEIQRPAFFGPAPDRYEDLINPGFAETPHQQQMDAGALRE